jgi:hypothetical protein
MLGKQADVEHKTFAADDFAGRAVIDYGISHVSSSPRGAP